MNKNLDIIIAAKDHARKSFLGIRESLAKLKNSLGGLRHPAERFGLDLTVLAGSFKILRGHSQPPSGTPPLIIFVPFPACRDV